MPRPRSSSSSGCPWSRTRRQQQVAASSPMRLRAAARCVMLVHPDACMRVWILARLLHCIAAVSTVCAPMCVLGSAPRTAGGGVYQHVCRGDPAAGGNVAAAEGRRRVQRRVHPGDFEPVAAAVPARLSDPEPRITPFADLYVCFPLLHRSSPPPIAAAAAHRCCCRACRRRWGSSSGRSPPRRRSTPCSSSPLWWAPPPPCWPSTRC